MPAVVHSHPISLSQTPNWARLQHHSPVQKTLGSSCDCVLNALVWCLLALPLQAYPDGLYCNTLPFAEDIREFLFTSLDSHPARLQPSEAQRDAAQELVRALDLGPSASQAVNPEAGSEMLVPEETFNPTLQASCAKNPPVFILLNHLSVEGR